MTAIELKKMLIHRIAEIDDVSFLNAIKTILDSKTQSYTLHLTSEQRNEVIKSKRRLNKVFSLNSMNLLKNLKIIDKSPMI